MDLLQLQYFRAIAEYEIMTKAAQALFVSQPNLSGSMSRLEADLGVKLFERRRGKITLTAEGRLFLTHIQTALNEISAAVETLHSGADDRSNSIRVASGMPDLLGRLLARTYAEDSENPLSIKQVNCPNRMVPELVSAEEVDFGLYFGELDNSFLEHNVIAESERIALLRNDHPLAGQKYIKISELSGEKFICDHSRDDEAFLHSLPRFGGFAPNICYECDSLQMETTLVVSRGAVSICPITSYQRILTDDPDCPVSCLRFSAPVPPIFMSVVRRRGHLLSPAALEFFAHLTEHFEQEDRNTQELFRQLYP